MVEKNNKEKKTVEKKFNPKINSKINVRSNAGNAAARAESIRKMMGAMAGCGQNMSLLARKADVSYIVVRRILGEKRAENEEVQRAFAAEVRVTPAEIKRRDKVARLKKNIPLCKGCIFLLAELMGCSPATVPVMLRDKRSPEIKVMFNEEREKHNPLRVAGKKERSELEKFLGKGLGDDERNYNLAFDIEEAKENFLGHQVSFAYLPPKDVKHPALIGGFGCGKTMSIPLRWLKLIEFRMMQGKKCELMVIEPTVEMIQDILVPAFDEFFNKLGVPVKYLSDKRNYSIMYKGEKHTCIFRSGDRPRALTGKNLTDVIIDEFDRMPYVKQKQTWRECISRIRRAEFGTCAAVSTPEGFKLIHELWVEKKTDKFALIKAKTRDNIYLPEDFIDNLYEQYDSKLVKQYLEGEFVNIGTDIVYYCFDRKMNVIADDEIPRDDFERMILSFDFNVNPMCAVEIITVGKTRYQIYEHKISNSSTKELCESIIESLMRRYKNFAELDLLITGDASGAARSSSGMDSDYEIIKKEFAEAGFSGAYVSVGNANPLVRERANYVNALLEKQQFFIAKSCKASIKDREVVSWKSGSEKFVMDKSDRGATHLSDACDYGLWRSRFTEQKLRDKIVAIPRGR